MAFRTTEDLTALVNPLQGTYSVPEFSRGNTLPLVSRPFGLTHWSLQTEDRERWFFSPDTYQIVGVRATHQPSPWMSDYGQFTIMAQTGDPVLGMNERASAYRPETLTVLPHFLSVLLDQGGIRLEMTPTERCTLFRVTFPEGKAGRIIFDAQEVMAHADGCTLTGVSRLNSGGVPENFGCYFAAVFDRDWQQVGPSETGAAAEFAASSDGPLLVRVGTSFISADQALHNLTQEVGGKSFDEVQAEGAAVWNETLGRVQIDGGTDDQRRTFYSCLYRAHLFPRMFHEPDGEGQPIHYSPCDGNVYPGVLYTDNGFWDTYRTVYPLLSLIQPERLGEIVQGWVNFYREGGWLPNWPSPGYRSCMIGTHIDAVIADACVKGIGGFDREAAYAGMVKHAETFIEGERGYGRIGLREYLRLGYVPADKYDHATARTLDTAYDDFCLSQVAKVLGKPEGAEKYAERALSYKNVYDPETTFMRGRNTDGSWLEPFDPYAWGDPYIEGSAWQFNFQAIHDPAGLAALFGGSSNLLAKLDRFLYQPPTFRVGTYGQVIHEMAEMAAVDFGQHDQGNQPVHAFLLLFTAVGSPWKTQYWTRRVLDILYSPDHFPGDEDNGEMASWYVLHALGLGPLCPGVPEYVLTSPLFPAAHIVRLGAAPLHIEAVGASAQNAYVQQVTLNGAAHSGLSVAHDSLMAGGTLQFDLGPEPPQRQIAPGELPFSLSPALPVVYDEGAVGPVIRINCGGDELGAFVGDAFVHGGESGLGTAPGNASADLPPAVHETTRRGAFTYAIPLPRLPGGRSYTLRLCFAGADGQSLSLNGQSVPVTAAVQEFPGLQPGPKGSLDVAITGALAALEVLIAEEAHP